MKDKDHVKRFLAGMKKMRSYEESKEIKEIARTRDRKEGPRRERRDWSQLEEDEEENYLFERLSHRRGALPSKSREETARAAGSPAAAYEENADEAEVGPRLTEALVIWVGRGRARVSLGKREIECSLTADISRTQRSSLAVGDRVRIEEGQDGPSILREVLPRASLLSRPDDSHPGRQHAIAANVDLGIVVLSARNPALKPGLADRFLIHLERGGVQAAICVNKIDLCESEEERRGIARILEPYTAIGLTCLMTSTGSGEGLGDFSALVRGRTVCLVGHSGVGKSSLLHSLDPLGLHRTGTVREADGKGRHTTTWSSLWQLPDGVRLIDTPGIRTLGMGELDSVELRAHFPEFDAFSGSCRFSDCAHLGEPACAVRSAVASAAIARARYEAYVRLCGEC